MFAFKMISTIIAPLALSACIMTGASELDNVGTRYNNLADLKDFGTTGGTLILGYVDRWDDEKIRLPAVPDAVNATNKERAKGVFELKDFYDPDPRDESKWIGPEIELGALYYIPKRYESDPDYAVAQKLCGIEKGHRLGDIAVIDSKGPQTGSKSKRKFVVSGSVAKGLLKGITPLSLGLSANAQYVFEVEISDVRRRYIRRAFAERAYHALLSGPECRKEYLPSVRQNRKLLLQEFYYGNLTITQIGEVEVDADANVISLKGNYERLNQDSFFVAFKWYEERD